MMIKNTFCLNLDKNKSKDFSTNFNKFKIEPPKQIEQ